MPRLALVSGFAGGDGARLQQVKGVTAHGPFHVLGATEEGLGAQRLIEHQRKFPLINGRRGSFPGGERDKLDPALRRPHSTLPLGLMVAEHPSRGAVEEPAIRLDGTVHQPLV